MTPSRSLYAVIFLASVLNLRAQAATTSALPTPQGVAGEILKRNQLHNPNSNVPALSKDEGLDRDFESKLVNAGLLEDVESIDGSWTPESTQ